MAKSSEQRLNVAEAKRQLSDLLGRVAYAGETILITRRGRPMARLVPPGEPPPGTGLASVDGWLDDDDPFLDAIAEIVSARRHHPPRARASCPEKRR
ncbi:MAG TPA: type II toxin-antitoxin system prevent-host-death family antitoxin [Thermoanaerobaculia bacterium]|nr:type II toxin-antitoxin system prevent-host-death family antitoxin [Thermoanaerobaculia bacterium]